MPCTYHESPEEIAQAAAKAKARRNRELNKVTALLCAVCQEFGRDIESINGLSEWWKHHKKRDRKRKEKEKQPIDNQKKRTVSYRDVSTIAMVAGNEKKFDTIIHNGIRKHWVGIGWVDEGRATNADKAKYPTVK